MLNHLLELLQSGPTRLVSDLARELETTPELVELMLADLERMGYLRQARAECVSGCGGCSQVSTCAAGGPGRVWVMTSCEAAQD
jgi:hypothetical protein